MFWETIGGVVIGAICTTSVEHLRHRRQVRRECDQERRRLRLDALIALQDSVYNYHRTVQLLHRAHLNQGLVWEESGPIPGLETRCRDHHDKLVLLAARVPDEALRRELAVLQGAADSLLGTAIMIPAEARFTQTSRFVAEEGLPTPIADDLTLHRELRDSYRRANDRIGFLLDAIHGTQKPRRQPR